ncbi:MAG: NAD(P)H-binding protein [Chitinophagaceae bacterium]|nr:NAD(P)H-binding protein [Rubrivivax sp.]
MNIIVFGATGGTGRAVTQVLLAQGHTVTAFARRPAALSDAPGQRIVAGDAMNAEEVAGAVVGHDAVVVSLGNSQDPFAKMFGARRTTPANICEVGTRHIIAAMKPCGIRRLVLVSAFGVGDTRDQASWLNRLFFRLVLREHMADKELQEAIVKASGVEWTLVQPVALVDKPSLGQWTASKVGAIGGSMISRTDLAAFIALELASRQHLGMTVTLSGATGRRD